MSSILEDTASALQGDALQPLLQLILQKVILPLNQWWEAWWGQGLP